MKAQRAPAARRPAPRGRSGRQLRLLWAGQSVSLLGDQVTLLALPLAALASGASVAQVAVLAAACRAPFLLLGLPAGVWVSRVGLRRSMLLADLLRAAALASLPVTAAFGTVPYFLLLLVAAALGCGSVLFQVAYQSLTPLLIEDLDLLRSANTRLTASEALALIGGPALAGLLAGAIGAARALAADAASYLVSAGTLTALRAPADRPARSQVPMCAEIHAGIRYLLGNAPLRAVLWSSMLFNAGIAGYEALLVVFAVQHLGLSPAVLGLAVGAGGIGVPIGLLLSGSAERRLGVGPVLILSGALSGAGLLVTGIAGGRLSGAVIGLGTYITAVGGGAWGLTALTTRQTLSRPDMRAMTTAVFRWASYGVLPLGALLAGLAASLMGPRPAILLAGVISQLCVVPLLGRPVRTLRALTPATAGSAHGGGSRRAPPLAGGAGLVPGSPADKLDAGRRMVCEEAGDAEHGRDTDSRGPGAAPQGLFRDTGIPAGAERGDQGRCRRRGDQPGDHQQHRPLPVHPAGRLEGHQPGAQRPVLAVRRAQPAARGRHEEDGAQGLRVLAELRHVLGQGRAGQLLPGGRHRDGRP